MAIVPPGNKQVGEYTGVLTLAVDGAIASNYGASLDALVYDQSTAYTLANPKNVMVGEYTGVATVAADGAAVVNNGMAASAVVMIETPPAMYSFGMAGLAVMKSPDPNPGVLAPLNVMVGEYTGIATAVCNGARVCNYGMSAEVVVQNITARVETLLINLAYPEGFTG